MTDVKRQHTTPLTLLSKLKCCDGFRATKVHDKRNSEMNEKILIVFSLRKSWTRLTCDALK